MDGETLREFILRFIDFDDANDVGTVGELDNLIVFTWFNITDHRQSQIRDTLLCWWLEGFLNYQFDLLNSTDIAVYINAQTDLAVYLKNAA